jgi:hypothetical protein
MSMTLPDRQARLAFMWVVAYTSLVTEDARLRRREEMLSHLLHLPRRSGGQLRRSVRGSVADLQWCSEVRRHAGRPGLITAAVVGETGGLVTAGVLMLTTVLLAITIHHATEALAGLAGLVFIFWLVSRHSRHRSERKTSLSSH